MAPMGAQAVTFDRAARETQSYGPCDLRLQ